MREEVGRKEPYGERMEKPQFGFEVLFAHLLNVKENGDLFSPVMEIVYHVSLYQN